MNYFDRIKLNGVMDDYVTFVIEKQLKNGENWNKFCEVFSTREDVADEGWRAEYFGKLMRGAVWIYRYSRDEELYEVMTEAALNMLSRQDSYGRFSTYTVEKEFCGWDVWGRKYILTGMLHYCSICKDENLKNRIMSALGRHLDYIVAKIGEGEGQIPLTATSFWWGGVNSCSVLEPVVEMYKRTGKKEYLNFAEYILSTGGCADGNLIDLALDGEKLPYQYPVVKAYEIMSFFEGVLAYYEVTGIEKCYNAVLKFVEALNESDITIIGCAGCTHELFDHAAVKQTEYSDVIMQETCVTVTWMRLLSRLYILSGNPVYIDRIERAGFNALYGSINTEGNEQYSFERNGYVSAMPFDSYSPLYMNRRGRGIGGYKEFASGGYYGCCVAIAACGIALMPLTAVMRDEKGVYINFLCNAELSDGNYTLKMQSRYPADGKGVIQIVCENEEELTLRIRKPAWCPKMTVNGKAVNADGYYELGGRFKNGQTVEVEYEMALRAERLNGKTAFLYGPLVMAADALKNERDIGAPISEKCVSCGILPPQRGELVRLELGFEDGKLLLTDYQSCGKKWLDKRAVMTVWLNGEERVRKE